VERVVVLPAEQQPGREHQVEFGELTYDAGRDQTGARGATGRAGSTEVLALVDRHGHLLAGQAGIFEGVEREEVARWPPLADDPYTQHDPLHFKAPGDRWS
jgi:hypothetical protein